MTRLENKDSVGELFTKTNGESSVYMTQKRLKHPTSKVQVESEKIEFLTEPKADESSYPILIRVTDGAKQKKTKYSTIVSVENLDQFWVQYTNILKNGVTGLKKKDKKKKSKKKVTKN